MGRPIAHFPTRHQCRDIVDEFCEETRRENDLGHDEYTITGRIPMVVSSKRVSLDHEKIEEMDLTCHHRSNVREFDPDMETSTIIRPMKFTASYATSAFVDPWLHDRSREMAIDNLADMIEEACRKGFIKEPVYGERYESKEIPIDMAMSVYTEESKLGEGLPELFESVRRKYKCGTIRYGIDGVVHDSVWWESNTDR